MGESSPSNDSPPPSPAAHQSRPPQSYSLPPASHPVRSTSAACRVVRSASSNLAALVNCDRTLNARLLEDKRLNGSFGSLMHDSGAGLSSYSPYHDDFLYFTDISPAFFGGAAGGSSVSPARGVIAAVGLDDSAPPTSLCVPHTWGVLCSVGCHSPLRFGAGTAPRQSCDDPHAYTAARRWRLHTVLGNLRTLLDGRCSASALWRPYSTVDHCMPEITANGRLGRRAAHCSCWRRLHRWQACDKEGELQFSLTPSSGLPS